MAYINGNKPIITNGLVYALDFGNTKSYTSGSNTARSMVFDPAGTTVVTGSAAIPVLSNGVLNFTGSQFVRRTGSIDTFASGSAFTVQVVGKANSSGNLFSINTPVGNLSTSITPSSSLFGFNLPSGDFSRGYRGFTSSSLQHITYRYSQGTVDIFLNGIPVTASAANSAITTTTISNALFINSGSNFFSGSVAQFYVYNRALSSDEIYENYLVSAGRNNLPVIPKPYTQDENVFKFLQTTGITDSNTVSAVSTFVSNLKSNGLWNKMTAIYPFLTTLTGSQTVNLKDPGVLGLGLTGSFTGSNVGLTPSNSTAYVDALPSNIPYPLINSASAHLSLLSYDVPQGNGFLAGNSLPALGGDLIIQSGSKIYHAFKTVGTSSFTPLVSSITDVEVMVIAGGGSGGRSDGGGGGAGGLIYSSSVIITPNTQIQVIVGGGGDKPITGAGNQGKNSIFGSITATGGGGGGTNSVNGQNGGSGGGGGHSSNSGSGIIGQGFDGGTSPGVFNGAGGGGASEKGHSWVTGVTISGSQGGSGSYYPQFVELGGSPAGWFAGGGGGSNGGFIVPVGGIGGGGGGGGVEIGGGVRLEGGNGVPNTGGGGGGSKAGPASGNGGSGIVIVGYTIPPGLTAITGSGTGIYFTDSTITGSVNSRFTAGITGSGTIGFLTVNRNISSSFSIHKNNISQSISAAASASLPTDIFFNAAGVSGASSLPQPTSISYASIGAGLTDSEVSTYYNLVSQFQSNLKRQNTLLDNFTGAAAAYSLRRIGPSGYFGPAIRVRRDSDNTLRDIGFTSDGQLDTVGLLDFVGVTGSGFVNTWYDQSGNNRNASQATNANQPLLIISGSILVQGIRPLIRFNSNLQILNTVSFPLGVNRTYVMTLYNQTNTNALSKLYLGAVAGGADNLTNGLNGQFTISNNVRSYIGSGTANNAVGTGAMSNGSYVLLGAYVEGSVQHQIYRNNVLNAQNTSLTISPTTNSQVQSIMYTVASGNDLRTNEAIIWDSYQSTNRTGIEDNINTNYKIFGSATASFDPDYQSFITATGITQPTQSAALETLVSDLKSYGLWSKMKAIYPMVTDRNNRFAQSEAFNLTWNAESASVSPNQIAAPDGTTTGDLILDVPPTETTYMVDGDGSNYYFTSSIDGPIGGGDPTLTLEKGKTYIFNITAPGVHPFYILTGSGYTAGGVYNDGVSGYGTSQITFVVPESAPNPLYYGCSVHLNMAGQLTINENSSQHYIYQTIDGATGIVTGSEYVLSTYAKFFNTPYIAFKTNTGAQAWFDVQTGVTGSYTGSNATITNVGNGWYRCALYFTSSVATGPYNQQIHLARTNNDLTFAGTGTSGSYLWGAQFENGNLLGPYRKTEGSGFAVSGSNSMLDQMKFNLKNPVDTNAGFRLTYTGSTNPGYSGVKSDGTTGYIITNFNPSSSQSTPNDLSLSTYSRTITINQGSDLGSSDGSSFIDLKISNGSNSLTYDGFDNTTHALSETNSDTRGYYLVNHNTSTVTQVFRNKTVLVGNSDPQTLPYPDSSIAILTRLDNNISPTIYSDRETALVTIGDGLTDYEAKALYWIVQKFQTTLGRQVY